MSKSPAFEYGRTLGTLQRLFEEAAQQMMEGFREALRPKRAVTDMMRADPETWALIERERQSIHRYQMKVEWERKLGREYVESLTDGLRKRYGL